MADIARRAGVQRPAVSNWRRRHATFPEPFSGTDPEVFDAVEVAAWLDHRRIPANALTSGEAPGTTYGDRFRRTFEDAADGTGRFNIDVDDAPPGGEDRVPSTVASLADLLMQFVDAFRNIADPQAFGDLVLAMVYLRSRAPQLWSRFMDGLEPAGSEPAVLLDALLRKALPRWADDLRLGHHGHVDLKDGESLREIARLLDRNLKVPGPGEGAKGDLASRLFRHLLERFAATEGHRGGEFHTPASVADLVVRLIAPAAGESLCDPCCGTGELLTAAATRDLGARRVAVRGEALGIRARRLATMHLEINGVPAIIGSSAADGLRRGSPDGDRYDVVVTNPPFNISRWTAGAPSGDRHWRYGVPPEHNANFAWLQHAASMLADRGRAAVIMADNAAFSARPAERVIRAAMVEDGLVECIVALPAGLFAAAPGVRTNIWLLRKGRRADDGVLFIDAVGLRDGERRTAHGLRESDIERIAQTYHGWLDGQAIGTIAAPGFAKRSSLAELRSAGYDLNARMHVAMSPQPVDRDQLVRDVRHLEATLAELRRRAARVDDRLAGMLEEVAQWRA